jgi:hypothetical protein
MMAALKTKPTDEGTDRTIHVRLSRETHRLLRIRVADVDTNMQDWVAALITETLRAEPVSTEPRALKAWEKALSRGKRIA